MVLYGIWLIDANSGLLLSHVTIPGFTFNPDLFSGFIAASHDFAQETSGGKLSTIAMGNFKLLIRRGRVLMKVLAVGARDPETRYDQFFKDIEEKVDPVLAHLHREPNGFKAVTIEFRRQLMEIITKELSRFVTRKAPSDLSELAILQEDEARTLIQALLQRQRAELVPKLATTKIGYSYPLASSITGLDDEAALQLLEHLADYGLLLAEVSDSSLACPQCDSLHLHPHILCPGCQTPAQPVELFEHLPCGTISVKLDNEQELYCNRCGTRNGDSSEFRVFRGYQCQQCNSFFKKPQMVFTCHSCHTITEPENAKVRVLKKYVLNPALISDLEFILAKPKKPLSPQISTPEIIEEPTSLEPSIFASAETIPQISSKPGAEELLGSTVLTPVSIDPVQPVHSATEPLEKIVTGDEAQLIQELNSLESALRSGTITEAEYDRKFVQLKLQLRRIRSQETL
ncbi:MAG: hypothetical protein ACFFDJ_03275 [Candidatus Odinarchaeota archaeon]